MTELRSTRPVGAGTQRRIDRENRERQDRFMREVQNLDYRIRRDAQKLGVPDSEFIMDMKIRTYMKDNITSLTGGNDYVWKQNDDGVWALRTKSEQEWIEMRKEEEKYNG